MNVNPRAEGVGPRVEREKKKTREVKETQRRANQPNRGSNLQKKNKKNKKKKKNSIQVWNHGAEIPEPARHLKVFFLWWQRSERKGDTKGRKREKRYCREREFLCCDERGTLCGPPSFFIFFYLLFYFIFSTISSYIPPASLFSLDKLSKVLALFLFPYFFWRKTQIWKLFRCVTYSSLAHLCASYIG